MPRVERTQMAMCPFRACEHGKMFGFGYSFCQRSVYIKGKCICARRIVLLAYCSMYYKTWINREGKFISNYFFLRGQTIHKFVYAYTWISIDTSQVQFPREFLATRCCVHVYDCHLPIFLGLSSWCPSSC